MHQVPFYVIIATVTSACSARDALKYFIDHRKLHNYSFTVLASMNMSDDVFWIEYDYYFKNDVAEQQRTARNLKLLNIGVFENRNIPFDCRFVFDNETMTDERYMGYSIEILELLQEQLRFRVNYIKLKYPGSEHNLTALLLQNAVDLLLCHPGIDYEKDNDIIQLHPTLKSDYALIYKSSKLHFTKDIFILTFAGTLWLCFLVLLIILALCLHITTRHYSYIYFKCESWTWVDITLWANAAACQQGLSHTPNGFASRFIFFLGYLTSYLLYTGFAAGITSLLLQQGMNNDITVKDLETMKLKTVVLADMTFINNVYSFINNSLPITSMDDLFLYIDQDNTVGIAPKILIDQYFANKFNYDMISLYSVSVLGTLRFSRGFVVPKSDTYRHTLNSGLAALQESGLLANALQHSLLPSPTWDVTSNYSSAAIEHVGSAILILIVGTLSSAIFLVAELIVALYKSRCYGHPSLDDVDDFNSVKY